MKKDAYWEKQTKHQLGEKRRNGQKFAIWKLTPNQKAYVESLGYKVEPHLYEITTRTFYNVRGIKHKILEDIHYAKVRKENSLVRTLSQMEQELLDEFRVKYRILKYKIHLCE